jgi:hypothetical protein
MYDLYLPSSIFTFLYFHLSSNKRRDTFHPDRVRAMGLRVSALTLPSVCINSRCQYGSMLHALCCIVLTQMAFHLPVLCQCTASSRPLNFPCLSYSSLDSWYSISCIYCLQCKCLEYLLLGRAPLALVALLTGRVVLWCGVWCWPVSLSSL